MLLFLSFLTAHASGKFFKILFKIIGHVVPDMYFKLGELFNFPRSGLIFDINFCFNFESAGDPITFNR